MSAGLSLQSEIVELLGRVEEVSGIFDGPPARAAFPYIIVDAGTEGDWSHKSGEGREVAVALTLWDDQPARVQRIAARAEELMGQVARVDGWELISLRFTRKRIVRDIAGPWAAALDYRARLLKSEGE